MMEKASDKGGSVAEQTMSLEALESKAEKALEKAETGWREFTEAMRQIKESSSHTEAGYRHFQPYYRERWQGRTGTAYNTVETNLRALAYLEQIERAAADRELDLPMPGPHVARELAAKLRDPGSQVEAWEHHLDSGRSAGRNREGIRKSIAEYKGEDSPFAGVIEQAEARGVVVPDEPRGKTPSEVAWLKMAEASRAIRGVEPKDAARVESGKVAARYVEQMAELAEWMHLFVHELNLYAEETASTVARKARYYQHVADLAQDVAGEEGEG